MLRLQYYSELIVLGWKLKVLVRGFRICDCLVDWICGGLRVLVNSWGFKVYGTVGEIGDFGVESGVNLIRMTWEWVGFEACE